MPATGEVRRGFVPRPLRPNRRCLHLQSGRARHQEQLDIHILGSAELEWFGTHANEAAAQAALQGTDGLPFQPIQRIASGMRLRDDAAAEPGTPAIVVTGGARQLQLTQAPLEPTATVVDETVAIANRVAGVMGMPRD